ncbi:hypothetical protein LBMAG21_13440 [Armatimonadota bacterium]|nr:hypothetical protein LBMAG21_13440 [Armatimonadota bacterium]
MPEFDGLTAFRKSGFHRVRDAKHLLSSIQENAEEQGAETRHTRGAMYLCGYGIECLLKAYLISQHPHLQRLSDVLVELRKTTPDVRDICGASGHDLPYLLTLTGLSGSMDETRKRQANLCSKWRSSWRYNHKVARRDDAEAMVDAASELVKWINSQF